MFSRITYQRRGSRTQVVRRDILHQSDILLTPFERDHRIDATALGRFIEGQYEMAGVTPDMIDTGALILTGIAAGTGNAAAIGELFAAQAGRFVAVAAGDALETTLAAHGSGAVAASAQQPAPVLSVDIGGGTTKIAMCSAGSIVDLTAVSVGARLICLDTAGCVARIEPAGQALADAAGVAVRTGQPHPPNGVADIASMMAKTIVEACGFRPISDTTRDLLRLAPLSIALQPKRVILSGGVAAYLSQPETPDFGDLGAALAQSILTEMQACDVEVQVVEQPIRATVIGASQHSVQLSGNTIFVEPDSVLPLSNVPVISPDLHLDAGGLNPAAIADAITRSLRTTGLAETASPLALFYNWRGDATHARLDTFCSGLALGLAPYLAQGLPLILVGNSDIGGLIGLHCSRERRLANAVISLDGITAGACDFIDIGEILLVSGGVPVVVKSLIFPSTQCAAGAPG